MEQAAVAPQEARARKPRVKMWRLAALFVLVVVALWGCSMIVRHVMLWRYARDMVRMNPDWNITPQPLTNTAIADLSSGTTLDKCGYTFRVPWSHVLKQVDLGGVAAQVTFVEGASVTIFSPDGNGQILQTMRGLPSEQRTAVENAFGFRPVNSNYEFVSAQLHETGAEIGLMQSNYRNMKAMFLLGTKPSDVKSMFVLPANESTRGFQLGDPAKGEKQIRLLLFDRKDREIQLWIRVAKDGPALTQEQVNGIVASVKVAD